MSTPARLGAGVLIVGLVALSLTAGPVAAVGTDIVTSCNGSATDPGSLPYVVQNASSGDVVTFSVTCPPTTAQGQIILADTVDITTDLTIEGPGADLLTVADDTGESFSVAAGVTATISGLTIRGDAPAGTVGGGGVRNDGTLSVTDSRLQDDSAGFDGGGIYNAGTLHVTGSTLAGDGAKVDGGAIFNDGGTVTVTDSTLLANTAASHGGAVYNAGTTSGVSGGTVTITGSALTNNTTGDTGGGIYNDLGATVNLTDTTVSGSGGALDGGGLYNLGAANVNDSSVSRNTAYRDGGGIYNVGSVMVSNSTLAGNVTADGGGIDNNGGTATITSSSVVDNEDGDGFGGGITNPSGTIGLAATIVAGSTLSGPGSAAATECSGAITDLLYNLDDDASCGFAALTDHSHSPAGLDPAGLEDHGGPTQTVALLPGSLAIGSVTSSSLCSAPDQRGLARPTPCDIGAYETNPSGLAQTITFTSMAPAEATVLGPTYAVSASASSGLAVLVQIDPSSSSVCYAAGSSIVFTGAGMCTIDANQGGNLSYNPAPQVQQVVDVGKATQVITFTSTPPEAATADGPPYLATAISTGAWGNAPILISVDATASAVCSIPTTVSNGSATIDFIGEGTCVIDANQAGNANFSAAAQVQQSVGVGGIPQAIRFTSSPPAHARVGGKKYAVRTIGGPSGEPVIVTVDPASVAVCSLSGRGVAFIGAGTCTVDANQSGNGTYGAAPETQQSFRVKDGSTRRR